MSGLENVLVDFLDLFLNQERAYFLIKTIDVLHNPEQWTWGYIIAEFCMLEVFLPSKERFENAFDRFFSTVKIYTMVLWTWVLFHQFLFGGCIVQIPQNFLAKHYIPDREYWYQFGLVYRENFPESQWAWLRFSFLLISLFMFYVTWIWYKKRYRVCESNWQKEILAKKGG